MKTITLQTPCGALKGIETERCYEFHGVRYARAARYEYPKEQTAWEGVYDATAPAATSTALLRRMPLSTPSITKNSAKIVHLLTARTVSF